MIRRTASSLSSMAIAVPLAASLVAALAVHSTAPSFGQAGTPPAAPPAAAPATPAPPPAPPKDAPAKDTSAQRSPRKRAAEIKEIRGVIETSVGNIAFKLEPNKTPLLCANFCMLVRRGFFDGRPWRDTTRVIRQCGTDTVWYTLPREFDPALFFDKGGQLAMSRDIDDSVKAKSHGTRFFVTTKEQERWNLDFPIFGSVTSGLDIVLNLKAGDLVKKISVDGDVDALLLTFEPEVADWTRQLDSAERRGAH